MRLSTSSVCVHSYFAIFIYFPRLVRKTHLSSLQVLEPTAGILCMERARLPESLVSEGQRLFLQNDSGEAQIPEKSLPRSGKLTGHAGRDLSEVASPGCVATGQCLLCWWSLGIPCKPAGALLPLLFPTPVCVFQGCRRTRNLATIYPGSTNRHSYRLLSVCSMRPVQFLIYPQNQSMARA